MVVKEEKTRENNKNTLPLFDIVGIAGLLGSIKSSCPVGEADGNGCKEKNRENGKEINERT